MAKKTYHGSCLCGAIRFEADIDLARGSTRCNCGFCRKQRMWFAIVPKGDFHLVAGEEAIVDWQRSKPSQPQPFLHFEFCRTCGGRPFTRGGFLEAIGSEFYAVSLTALDDASDEELAAVPIQYADGRHDAWDRAPQVTSYL